MLPFLLSFLLCISYLHAEPLSDNSVDSDASETVAAELNTLAEHLGRSLEDVIARDGLPDEMYTVRGPSDGQDSVVFFYKNRISMFWAESHVWQIRADREYLSDQYILQMGMSRDEVISVLGKADLDKGEYYIYTLPQRGYPVSCALYFEEDKLSDLYVYRSDY
ncbi:MULTISPECIES: hypothetical protein [unclassified Oceanispirochaeta]|uniref:hypothetical protein n=1 Tax=unclassified Oceanispirochaeta TaxID=2635722 RepID=UPI000E091CC8|nr:MULTISPECIES: hypothetical protein [unclassified Oceanispirochaeta]MBF9014397.1 hypothetical protein [Oceanispirochaeta sp. M2]NPD71283.1 hypothetical protein [Oceanispirochaeta sp. M1]RDG33665.1 hypothetical protein DV872_04135 [Oceanispirochaeta sp. M1]